MKARTASAGGYEAKRSQPNMTTTQNAKELCLRLEAWPSPKTGADYSVNAIKEQMQEAAALIRHQADEIERLRDVCSGHYDLERHWNREYHTQKSRAERAEQALTDRGGD